MVYHTHSSAETEDLGCDIARGIITSGEAERMEGGALVVALYGELGGGKTTFARGFADGLGVTGNIVSPTFIFVRRFVLEDAPFAQFYHIDCYRLGDARDSVSVGLEDILSRPDSVVLVEWADRIEKLLPPTVVRVVFEHADQKSERVIRVSDF